MVKGDNPWNGEIATKDSKFVAFDTPENGIRALGKQLLIYQDKHDRDSVTDIISKWAPKEDGNDTAAYISKVSHKMGVDANESLNLRDPETLRALTVAIIEQENGWQPYSERQLQAGLSSAIDSSGPGSGSVASGGLSEPTIAATAATSSTLWTPVQETSGDITFTSPDGSQTFTVSPDTMAGREQLQQLLGSTEEGRDMLNKLLDKS